MVHMTPIFVTSPTAGHILVYAFASVVFSTSVVRRSRDNTRLGLPYSINVGCSVLGAHFPEASQ